MAPTKFEYDLFISYTSADDKAREGVERGWVSSFQHFLETLLQQMLGEKPKILRTYDEEKLNEDLFSKVGIFISIVSPDYIEDQSCLKQVDVFNKSTEKAGKMINGKHRLFKVHKLPVNRGVEPENIRQLLGYEMYHRDPDTREAMEFENFFDQNAEREYWMKLADLAYDIYQVIKELKIDRELNKGYKPEADAGSIYLAETGIDLIIQRDIIRRELQRHGFRVLPEESLPLGAPELTQMVKRDLKDCRISIHLVGEDYGDIPQGTDASIPEIQNKLATEYANEQIQKQENFERLIWVSPYLKMQDDTHKSFVEKIQKDAETLSGAEVLQTPLEDMKSFILDILINNKSYDEIKVKTDTKSDGKTKIYLIHEKGDKAECETITNWLEAQGYEVITTAFEGNVIDLRHAHQDNLKRCDASIIYYGNSTEQWVKTKYLDLLKAPGFGRTKPLKAKAIYIGKEEVKVDERLTQNDTLVIEGGKKFSSSLLEEFLDKIKRN